MNSKALFFALLAAAGLFFASCTEQAASQENVGTTANPELDEAKQVARGEYLVTVMGCDDCHSPKVMTEQGPAPDMSRRLSGHRSDEQLPEITDPGMVAPGQWALFNSSLTATVGPWGISFAANLTPDDTGIGNWTLEQFTKAIREGKSKGLDGARPLLPPMPWFNYRHLTDEDLAAVFAYLQSLPPVKNVVPNPLPPVAG